MKILVTGDKGRIGSRVVTQLAEQEHDVIGFDRVAPGLRPARPGCWPSWPTAAHPTGSRTSPALLV